MIVRQGGRTSLIRDLEDALFSPQKYGRSIVYGGTKEKPVVVPVEVRTVRRFNAWHDEDGSYHEELIVDEDENITNPGGTG